MNSMHEDPSYRRAKDSATGEEIGRLGYDCGSHCGVITIGHASERIGHCPCKDCHNKTQRANKNGAGYMRGIS